MKQDLANIFQRIYVMFQMFLMEKQLRDNLQLARQQFLIKYFATKDAKPAMELPPPETFPRIGDRLEEYDGKIAAYAKSNPGKPAVVMIGDSLAEFLQGTPSPIDINAGLAGGASPTFLYVIERLVQMCAKHGVVIEALVAGCFFGNALLYHQDYDAARRDATHCLYRMRQLLPKTFFVLCGMPPVYDIYAAAFQFEARDFFLSWIQSDKHDAYGYGGSSYLDICTAMGGFLGIMPKAAMSLESIHMNPAGKAKFVRMIEAGLKSLPGTHIITA